MPDLEAVHRGKLALLAEDNAQCALDLAEPPRIEDEGNFDHAICRSVDLRAKPPCSEFRQVQLEVPSIRFWFVRLNITNAAILVFELALNEEVRSDGHRQIKVGIRVFRIEGDLEIEPVADT
jgi:hypothetical protein